MMEILLSVSLAVFSWSILRRGSSSAAFLLVRPEKDMFDQPMLNTSSASSSGYSHGDRFGYFALSGCSHGDRVLVNTLNNNISRRKYSDLNIFLNASAGQ